MPTTCIHKELTKSDRSYIITNYSIFETSKIAEDLNICETCIEEVILKSREKIKEKINECILDNPEYAQRLQIFMDYKLCKQERIKREFI